MALLSCAFAAYVDDVWESSEQRLEPPLLLPEVIGVGEGAATGDAV